MLRVERFYNPSQEDDISGRNIKSCLGFEAIDLHWYPRQENALRMQRHMETTATT